MMRDVAQWIRECPQCQKIRARAIPSPIGAFSIFEDIIGPLPTDEVGNSCILNVVCNNKR